ncbi:hypothetical protein C0122_04395 [Moraxella catarrhalis]|nr:hypothetical protein [Moraxella catarrhalis]
MKKLLKNIVSDCGWVAFTVGFLIYMFIKYLFDLSNTSSWLLFIFIMIISSKISKKMIKTKSQSR